MQTSITLTGELSHIAQILSFAESLGGSTNGQRSPSAPLPPSAVGASKPGRGRPPTGKAKAPIVEDEELSLDDVEEEDEEQDELALDDDDADDEPAKAAPKGKKAAAGKSPITLTQIIAAFKNYAETHTRVKAQLILKQYKVKSARDLPESTWEAVMKKLT